MDKYDILKEITRKGGSVRQILKEFRNRGFSIGNEKALSIIQAIRKEKIEIKREKIEVKDKTQIIKQRDEYIAELMQDVDITFRELGKRLREKGFKIGNVALLEKYREFGLGTKIKALQKSVKDNRMQQSSAERIEKQLREYFKSGKRNKLNDLYGRLYDDENNPTFVDS